MPRKLQLRAMEILLKKSDSMAHAEIGQSHRFRRELVLAAEGDFDGLRLVLQYIPVLSIGKVTYACLVTASSKLSWKEKDAMYHNLLDPVKGNNKLDWTPLLSKTIESNPQEYQLPEILLNMDVKPSPNIMIKALRLNGSQAMIELLLPKLDDPKDIVSLFRQIRTVDMTSVHRIWIYKLLLKRKIPADEISETLMHSLESEETRDITLLKLLLDNGASPCVRDGKPFVLACSTGSSQELILRLLLQYVRDDTMANIAFARLTEHVCTGPSKRVILHEICRALLHFDINHRNLNEALLSIVQIEEDDDISYVRLLLEKGADPKAGDGRSFAVAANSSSRKQFDLLCRHADVDTVLRSLTANVAREDKIVRYLKRYYAQVPQKTRMDKTTVFTCMRRFPTTKSLLKLLLNKGLSLEAKTPHSLVPGGKPELCTPLIWALVQEPRIDNDVILELVNCGEAALPYYETPTSAVSAAFCCVLDKTRVEVLASLIRQNQASKINHIVAGTTFHAMTAGSSRQHHDDMIRADALKDMMLRDACVYLGNFDAFMLLAPVEMPKNDGLFHLVALLALPKFVKWLLPYNDPDLPWEEYDGANPLACACASRPRPWSIVADQEAPWAQRQKETLHLLAKVTAPTWRYRKSTILHYTMEHGAETTKALVEALDIASDPNKETKYRYTDRDGVHYTPSEYVTKILNADDQTKTKLIECLDAAGFDVCPVPRPWPW